MSFVFRKATPQDQDAMLAVIDQARASLRQLGIDQWQDGYPNRETLSADIAAGHSWVGLAKGRLAGTAALVPGPEADYLRIEGSWHTPEHYVALHRIALADSSRGGGLAKALLARLMDEARAEGFAAMRSDTHHQNHRMRRFLEKLGFAACGTIYLADGAPRLAFDRPLP